jgi:hypothetical protein
MVQGRDRAGFALEALGELLLRDFDRHVADEAGIVRTIDLSHVA